MKILIMLIMSAGLFACSHAHKNHHGKSHHGKKHHKMWEKMDTNNDGFWTKEEFDKAHEDSFKAMDANSDGKITKEEIKSHHMKMKGEKKPCCK